MRRGADAGAVRCSGTNSLRDRDDDHRQEYIGLSVPYLMDAAGLVGNQPMPTIAETKKLAHALGNALLEQGT